MSNDFFDSNRRFHILLSPLILYISSHSRIQGEHDIDEDVYLSLPCVLTSNGVTRVVKQILTETESEQLKKSAALMHIVQEGLQW